MDSSAVPFLEVEDGDSDQRIPAKVWEESKQLWRIVGPSIFSLISSFTMTLIAQASSGHIGDLELASMSLALNVIVGIDFGLMLGMASALETLCGQAFGAKNYPMLGIYLQRSWIVLFLCCLVTLPVYLFASPILKALGQSPEIAELTGIIAWNLIPLHFSFAFQFPLQRFLQSQLHNSVIGWVNFMALVVHLLLSWLLVFKLKMGLIAIALALSFCWWLGTLLLLAYAFSGACKNTWTGFSIEAFSGLCQFLKLCISSGVMLCLESWYYQILVLIAGHVSNPDSFDALSICLSINTWEVMIPVGFLTGIGVRVANLLGEGNARKAKFATLVAVTQSFVLGLVFCLLVIFFHNQIASIFTTSKPVLKEINALSTVFGLSILLNGVQPVLSGVAIGSGWQQYVAYINLCCYYLVGMPLGLLMALVFKQGVMGIWIGMIFGGIALQTLVLSIIVIRCDWDKEVFKATLRVDEWSNKLYSTL